MVHESRFSPLNFCSLERIVKEGVLNNIVGGFSVSLCV